MMPVGVGTLFAMLSFASLVVFITPGTPTPESGHMLIDMCPGWIAMGPEASGGAVVSGIGLNPLWDEGGLAIMDGMELVVAWRLWGGVGIITSQV